MIFETRFTWDKLVTELKLLRDEDFGSLVPLCIGIQTVMWPKEASDACFRQLQFLGFEVLKACENKSEAERWENLRQFLFTDKAFQIASSRSDEVREDEIVIKTVLEKRCGHPLTVVFLLLHLAHFLDLPVSLVQARHHFLLKWVRSGTTIYLDLYNEGRALSDQQLIDVLNRSSSSLETWNAKELILQYLLLLKKTFGRDQNLTQLHTTLNLLLQLNEGDTELLGERALLRQKLGFTREALSDLKRYFSFIEKAHAPAPLQQAWLELEHAPEPPKRGPTELLH